MQRLPLIILVFLAAVLVGQINRALAVEPKSAPPDQTKNAKPSATAPATIPVPDPAPDEVLMLREFGDPLTLTGTIDGETLWFGIRADQIVTRAVIKLPYTFSPSLIPELSHLKVLLNKEVIAVIPLPKEKAGTEQTEELNLDPRFLASSNNLTFQLVGHYTRDCEDPLHTSLWASISNKIELRLWSRKIALPNELALLPVPFFDMRSNRQLTLPVYFNGSPNPKLIHASGVLSSWFGSLAGYRKARFPVSFDRLPEQHALLLLTNEQIPVNLPLNPVDEPTILVTAHPERPEVKFLVIQGKTPEQVDTAAMALVLGQAALSGPVATVKSSELPPPRDAYDAPNWVSTDRLTRLGDLVTDPSQLQVKGMNPPPIRLNLRIPPDLLLWQHDRVDLRLALRYTPPVLDGQSVFSISINDALVRAQRLKGETDSDDRNYKIRLIGSDLFDPDAIKIPAFQLGTDNPIEMRFFNGDYRQGWCLSSSVDSFLGGVDADSAIDFRGFHHYAALPDLGGFVKSGFPFTRYADLAETVVVLQDKPAPKDIEALLNFLSAMSISTGVPTFRYDIHQGASTAGLEGKDLLIISTSGTHPLINAWKAHAPAEFGDGGRVFGHDFALAEIFQFTDLNTFTQKFKSVGRASFKAYGALSALTGFESPLSAGRSVISFEANGSEGARQGLDALQDSGVLRYVFGDVAIFRNKGVQSYQVGNHYYDGELPIWLWLGFHLTRHPLLMALLGIGAGLVIAFFFYASIQRLRRGRLGES